MSLLLAIETSGTTCGVALFDNGHLIAENSLYLKNAHDKMLAELTRSLMKSVGYGINDVYALCISSGPGSFTGLRIGYSFAKGLIFNTSLKLIEVPTLQSCAFAAREFCKELGSDEICAVIHSHKELCYVQQFTSDGMPIDDISLKTVSELSFTENLDTKVICGAGANLLKGRGRQLSGLNRLTPRFVGVLGCQMMEEGKFSDPSSSEPLYSQNFTINTH